MEAFLILGYQVRSALSDQISYRKDNMAQEKQYYCKRCKASFSVLEDESGREKIETFHRAGCEFFSKKNCTCIPYAGRFLTCKHSVDSVKDLPISYSSESRIQDEHIDPAYLRDLNVRTTLEYIKMSDVSREAYMLRLVEDYQFHLRLTKEKKYQIQVIEDEVTKKLEELKSAGKADEARAYEIRFGYIFRQPEKRMAVIARERVKEESQEKKTKDKIDKGMERLKDLMRKAGLEQ